MLAETAGGSNGALTVTVMEAVVVAPAESVTRAVMVWVPLLRVFEKVPPVPIWPSRLEFQVKFAVKLPFSTSEAEPENVTVAPKGNEAPVAGLLIVTVGGLFAATVMETEAVVVLPAESVTRAVMVWVPLLRVLVKLPPVPIGPSIVELQDRFEVRLPSSTSDALPEKLTVAP